MPISSQDYVANTSLIDTYVPPPFKEMREALNQKQLEYDTEEKKLSELPSYLKANIKPTYTKSTGEVRKNANYDKYKQEAEAFNEEINNAAKTLNATSDPHEVRKLTSDITNRIANWKNNYVKQAEDESANYEANFKKLQEDKNKGKEPYRAYKHDLAIDSQESRDLSKGYVPVGFSDQMDYSDINKTLRETATAVPGYEKVRGSFGKYSSGGVEGFKEWSKSNGDNAKAIEQAIQPILDEHTPHIKAELIHSLANNPKYYKDMVSKGFNPNDENNIMEYANSLQTGKDGKSNLLKDFFTAKKAELTSAALGFTKVKDEYSENFKMSDYLTKKKDDEAIARQTYESSGTKTNNSIDFSNINDEKEFLKTNSMYPVNGAVGSVKTAKGNYVVDGDYIDKLKDEYESNTGKKADSLFGGYSDEYIKFINNKGIAIDNKKDIGSSFYYKDNDKINKELTKQKEIFKALKDPSTESNKELLTKNIPQFKGVYNLLNLQGIKNPTKEQLQQTYNEIAPSSVNGIEDVLSTEEMDHTVNLINSNLRHYKVYNKQGGSDEGTTINTIPVTHGGETKTLGEWIGSGGMTFQKLVDDGSISIGKESDNPNSRGGETIKTTDKKGNLIEYQTGGINNAQRDFFRNNTMYHSNVNNTKDYFNITEEEKNGGVIGSSNQKVKSDPLLLPYLANISPETSKRLSDGYYETKTKTKTTKDSRGVLKPITVISIYDATSGKFIGDIDKNDYMKFRQEQYNKGLIGQKK